MSTKATPVLAEVKSSGRTGASPEVRVVYTDADLPYGKQVRQGDVYLRRHPVDYPRTSFYEVPERQVAPGNTVGSRHVLRAGTAKLMRPTKADPLAGGLIYAPDGFYLEHPKHGDFDIRVPGCYEISFPQDLAAAQRARRRD